MRIPVCAVQKTEENAVDRAIRTARSVKPPMLDASLQEGWMGGKGGKGSMDSLRRVLADKAGGGGSVCDLCACGWCMCCWVCTWLCVRGA